MFSHGLGVLVLKNEDPRKDGADQVCTVPWEDGIHIKNTVIAHVKI